MTILGGGDLVPRRRGGSVGRWAVTALVIVLLLGGGYAAYLGLSGGSSSPAPVTALHHCAAPTVPGPTSPHLVHVTVLNGTLRTGLAAQVAASLRHRGFRISQVGNAANPVAGVATVRYGAGHLRDAQAVVVQIRGATLVKVPAGGVRLAVGPQFHALRTLAAAGAARAQLVARQAKAVQATGVAHRVSVLLKTGVLDGQCETGV